MRSYADDIFSALSDHMYAEEVSGTTEAPTGYFALVEVPSDPAVRAQMFKDIESMLYHDKIQRHAVEPGWYVVISTDQGITYPVAYDSELEARMAFRALDDTYARWGEDDPFTDSDVDFEGMHTWERDYSDALYCTACGIKPKNLVDMSRMCEA